MRDFEKVEEPRTAAYGLAGRNVVENCDVLIALWDGKPVSGSGGTAEVVEYAREVGRSLFRINSESGEIKEERHEDHSILVRALKYLEGYNSECVKDRELNTAVEAQYSTLTKQAVHSGLPKKLPAPLREHLLPQFVRADLLALRYQNRYMEAGSAIYALAAAAVATVTIQVLFFPLLFELLWFEVAEIALILILLWASHRGEWHHKWLDFRFLAERLRAALFLSVAGIECKLPTPPPHLALSHRPDDWMVKAFLTIWDSRPQADSERENMFDPLKIFLLTAWIKDQLTFYDRASERHRRRHTRLARIGVVLFALTLVAATLHATGLGHLWLPTLPAISMVLASIAIIFPAIGAALAGFRMQREYLRNAERYSNMAYHLAIISNQIKQERDQKTLISLLEQANEVMLRENQDWRVVVLFQKLEPP